MAPSITRRAVGIGRAWWLAAWLCLIPPFYGPTAAAAQTGSLLGRLTDVLSGASISGARVRALDAEGSVAASALSGDDGGFILRGLRAGEYTVTVEAFGYVERERLRARVAPGVSELLSIALEPAPLPVARVVVSASRREEKILDAPAVVRVVRREQIEARPALTPAEQLRDAGADLARAGLVQANLVTRGFTNVFSGRALLLTDYRYAEVPSLALNAYHFLPVVDDDVDRIEVVHGPASAVYGPNTALGVVHIVTRSPFDAPGTSVSLLSGLRSAASPVRGSGLAAVDAGRGVGEFTVRHAGVLSPRWAYKVSGRLMRGGDWPSYDPVEDSARARAIAGGASPGQLRIGRRSFDIERWSGDARVDFRPRAGTEIVASAGVNESTNLGMTTLGYSQVEDWRYAYYQLRASHGGLFAQAFLNTSAAGSTYNLRTGVPTVDDSRVLAAQLQHTVQPVVWSRIVWGVDLRRTEPRTGGTINGRNEDDDIVDEAGVYAHTETRLGERFSVAGAFRLDHHSRLEEPVYSVRAGLTWQPQQGQSVRVFFNRAFEAPVPVNLFLDLVSADLGAFRLRALGVPEGGLPFRRDCTGGVGDLCMRSPWAPDRGAALPADAAGVWAGVMAALRALGGPDLTSIPAPPPGTVKSVLRKLDLGRGVFVDVGPDAVRDVPPLEPTITETIEAGYKGLIAHRVLVSANLHYTRKRAFLGSLTLQTPTVFFDRASLQAYLGNFVNAALAGAAATAIAGQSGSTTLRGVPAGNVVPEHALAGSPDLILSLRNHGDVDLWGGDVHADALLGDGFSVAARWAWVSRNLFPEVAIGPDTLALNAPESKVSVTGAWRAADGGAHAELGVRHNGGFAQNSGVYRGRVSSYTLLDASFGFILPFAEPVRLTVSAENLFDRRHREFVGAPELGRLLLTRLTWSF